MNSRYSAWQADVSTACSYHFFYNLLLYIVCTTRVRVVYGYETAIPAVTTVRVDAAANKFKYTPHVSWPKDTPHIWWRAGPRQK